MNSSTSGQGTRHNFAGETGAHAMDAVKGAIHAGVEGVEHAYEKVSDTVKKAGQQAAVAKEKLVSCIQDRPVTSVLVAFAAGALLARLLFPSHSSRD